MAINIYEIVILSMNVIYFCNVIVTWCFSVHSSFDALKKSLVGVQKYIQATDLSEASQEAVEEKLRATDRQ